ncbi:MAG: hypothetical protein M1831_007228 [Alyxoria varia]|nr:MAG: hypothetical protein M1831_007228 [Alyxoria varia]
MAPKTNTQPAKRASVLSYFHNSAVAHSIKDLEKVLPSVASINGMQVKDYLTSLTDEDQLNVEKIGSMNWYWAFAGQEKQRKEAILETANEERDKARQALFEVQAKVDEANKGMEGEDPRVRQEALGAQTRLGGEIDALKKELQEYADNDPVEIKRREDWIAEAMSRAENFTEQIVEMERLLRDQMGFDREQMGMIAAEIYEEEYDEEEGALKELHDPQPSKV